jgi:hypothetical protein
VQQLGQQVTCDPRRGVLRADVDRAGVQLRVLGRDRPDQPMQAGARRRASVLAGAVVPEPAAGAGDHQQPFDAAEDRGAQQLDAVRQDR